MPEVLVKNENIKYDIISNQKQHEKKELIKALQKKTETENAQYCLYSVQH